MISRPNRRSSFRVPPGVERAGHPAAPGTNTAADLAGCGRDAAVVCLGGDVWIAAEDRDHRREFRRFRPLVELCREAGRRAGHGPEQLRVGIHAFGFVGDDDEAAQRAYYPGWARSMTKIGRERGWPPATRGQFDAALGAQRTFLPGGPEAAAEKMLWASGTLGGLSCVSVQTTAAAVPHATMKRSIESPGTKVAPTARSEAGVAMAATGRLASQAAGPAHQAPEATERPPSLSPTPK
jgi:alkanesulfonate monooxygenase SsuD/methylene tetrahydromethanopterin reductase-like flavin-dependent oxidoreductase (luciferase family)